MSGAVRSILRKMRRRHCGCNLRERQGVQRGQMVGQARCNLVAIVGRPLGALGFAFEPRRGHAGEGIARCGVLGGLLDRLNARQVVAILYAATRLVGLRARPSESLRTGEPAKGGRLRLAGVAITKLPRLDARRREPTDTARRRRLCGKVRSSSAWPSRLPMHPTGAGAVSPFPFTPIGVLVVNPPLPPFLPPFGLDTSELA